MPKKVSRIIWMTPNEQIVASHMHTCCYCYFILIMFYFNNVFFKSDPQEQIYEEIQDAVSESKGQINHETINQVKILDHLSTRCKLQKSNHSFVKSSRCLLLMLWSGFEKFLDMQAVMPNLIYIWLLWSKPCRRPSLFADFLSANSLIHIWKMT